jgi:PST family polysaccharide transporter
VDQPATDFKKTASRGAYAAGMQQAVKITLQILSAVVMSRILKPADFGVYAMVTPIAAFVAMFQDMGLQQAVIQRKEITPELINRLYWLNFTATMIIAVFLICISPLVAWFYHDDRVILLTAALALPVVLGGIVYQHHAVMQRNLQFQRLAFMDSVCAVTQFVVAVTTAWIWRSYWSFWIAGVASILVFGMMASRWSGWRPGKPTLRGDTGGTLTFGLNMMGANLVNYVSRNVDKMLIGRSLGPIELGYYDRAYKLLLFPIYGIYGPLMGIMMPVLARLQHEPDRMRQAYYRFVGLVCLIAMPGIGIALAAPKELIEILLGKQWLQTADIFAWLGAVALFQPMTMTLNTLLVAKGKTNVIFYTTAILAVTTVVAFAIGLHDGAVGVARAFTIEEYCCRLPLQIYVVTRSTGVRIRDLMIRWLPLMVSVGLMIFAVDGLRQVGITGLYLLMIAGPAAYLSALALTALTPVGRGTIKDAWGMVHDALVMMRLRKASPPVTAG